MRCNNCKRKVERDYLYCPYCSEKICHTTGDTGTINAGRNNINIGLGNNSTQEIYIEHFNVPKQELIVEYDDRLEREVFGGVKGYKRKFEICGWLSVISAIVTITDFFLIKSNFTVLFLMAAAGWALYAFESREKHKTLIDKGVVYSGNNPVLSLEEDGKVYKVSKFGICPICRGRVFIYQDEKFKRKLGKCENNKDHLYTYDHTIDAGVPYTQGGN